MLQIKFKLPTIDDWDDTLYITGGALVPDKSFWTMIAFEWRNDGWRYLTSSELPGELNMKDPVSRNNTIVERIEPSEARETLGVFLAGDGNNKEQIKALREKSFKYAQCVKAGFISKYDVNHALRTTIMKSLEYPILTTDISNEKWNYILSPAIRASLPRMGFVRTLPKAFVYGPVEKGGLGIPNLFHLQHINQITHFIDESMRVSVDNDLLTNSLEQLILEVGLGPNIHEWPISVVSQYASKCWWTSRICYLGE